MGSRVSWSLGDSDWHVIPLLFAALTTVAIAVSEGRMQPCACGPLRQKACVPLPAFQLVMSMILLLFHSVTPLLFAALITVGLAVCGKGVHPRACGPLSQWASMPLSAFQSVMMMILLSLRSVTFSAFRCTKVFCPPWMLSAYV